MFDKEDANYLQNFKNTLERLKVIISDVNGSQRTAAAKKILDIDVAELNNAVKAFESIKAANANMTDSDAKTDAIAKSFKNASSAAKQYAQATELTTENVAKFKSQQEAAILAIQKGSLASKAASLATGLFAGAVVSLTSAAISFGLQKLWETWDNWTHRQEIAAQNTEKFRDELKALQDELQSLESELEKTQKRITELEALDAPTVAETDELNKLREQNAELEKTIELKRTLETFTSQKAANEASKYFGSESTYEKHGANGVWWTDNPYSGTPIEEAQYYISQIESLNVELEKAKQRQLEYSKSLGASSVEYQSVSGRIRDIEADIGEYGEELSTLVTQIDEQSRSLDLSTESGAKYKAMVDQLLVSVTKLAGNDNYIGTFMSSNGFADLDKSFTQMAANNELTREAIQNNHELVWMMTQAGIKIDDVIPYYEKLGQAQRDASNPPPIDLTSMEGLKTKLSEIIDKANILSEMDLNQAALSGGSEKQKEAWAELLSVMSTYGISLEDVQEKVVEFGLVGADGASKITQAFIDANQNSAVFSSNLSQITNRTDTLVNAYKELAKGQRLSSDVIMNLIQAYPKLETELTEYLAGLRSQQQIMLDLEAVYQADSENWKALMLAKLANSETFFQSIILGNQTWVQEFFRQYGVDLGKCTTYAQAKLKIFQAITNAAYEAARATSSMGSMQGPLTWEDAGGHLLAASNKIQDAIDSLDNISMGSLEGQFQSLNSAIDSTTSKANEAASALRSIASTSLSAINGLLDMTMSMLKQDLTTQKDQIEVELDGLKADYDATKNQLEADKKAALNDIEAQRKALQAKKKAQDKAYDDQIKHLQKVKDAQNDIYDDQIKAAEDELDAYNKIIDAQLKLLRLKEEQHDYERELADKQKDVADLEAKLAELGLDDSIEAQKKRLELEEELAAKKDELDEFQHDKNISDQEQALEDEKEAFEEKQQAIIDGIQAQKDAYNEMIDAQIEGIRDAKEAFDESIQAQLDALADQKDQTQAYYDAQLASLQRNYEADRASREQRKAELDKQINDTAALRKQAIELIQGKSDEFYQRLLEWNRKYGTGVDADVIMKWNNAYKALETFGGKQFDVLQVMNQLTIAGDGFTSSLEEAVKKAGDLEIALRNAVNAQAGLQFPKTYDEHRVSGGQLSTFKPGKKGAKYHNGGEVGKDNVYSAKEFTRFMDNLKTDEVPAVLKQKEWVLTEEQQGNILNLTNTQKEIIGAFERMYKAVSSGISNMPTTGSTSLLDLPSIPELATVGGDNTAVFNFNTTITGNADDDVMDNWFSKNVSAFEDRFARYTLGQVNFKRNIRTKR